MTLIDIVIVVGYFVFILGFGSIFSRHSSTTKDFFFGGQRLHEISSPHSLAHRPWKQNSPSEQSRSRAQAVEEATSIGIASGVWTFTS